MASRVKGVNDMTRPEEFCGRGNKAAHSGDILITKVSYCRNLYQTIDTFDLLNWAESLLSTSENYQV